MCDARENCEQLFETVAGTLGALYGQFKKFCGQLYVGNCGKYGTFCMGRIYLLLVLVT